MCLAAARPELSATASAASSLVSTSAGDLASGRRRPGGAPCRLKLAPAGRSRSAAPVRRRVRQLLPPTHPRHQKMVRDLSTAPTPPTRWSWPGRRSCTPRPSGRSPRSLPALGEHDKRTELKSLRRVPVEILVGDSDKLTPKRHSRQLAEALPDARCTSSSAPGTCSPRSGRSSSPTPSNGCWTPRRPTGPPHEGPSRR